DRLQLIAHRRRLLEMPAPRPRASLLDREAHARPQTPFLIAGRPPGGERRAESLLGIPCKLPQQRCRRRDDQVGWRELSLRCEECAQMDGRRDERSGPWQRIKCAAYVGRVEGPLRAECAAALQREQHARLETVYVLRGYRCEHGMGTPVRKAEPGRSVPNTS